MCLTCDSRKVGTCATGADMTSTLDTTTTSSLRGLIYSPQQVLVCDHQPDEISAANRLVHLLLSRRHGALVGVPAAGEQVGGHDHGHVPQGHLVLVLMENHLTQEDQQGLKPQEHIRNHRNR